jgi:HPt (histidine-containing phosphotransfer) domain-containing protein
VLKDRPAALAAGLQALADAAAEVDGSPQSRAAFDQQRQRWIEAMRATASVCAP